MPPVREDNPRVVLDYRNTTTTIERTFRGRPSPTASKQSPKPVSAMFIRLVSPTAQDRVRHSDLPKISI